MKTSIGIVIPLYEKRKRNISAKRGFDGILKKYADIRHPEKEQEGTKDMKEKGKNGIRMVGILLIREIDSVLLWLVASMCILFAGISGGVTDGTGITSPKLFKILFVLFLISGIVRTVWAYRKLIRICNKKKEEFVVPVDEPVGRYDQSDRNVHITWHISDILKSLVWAIVYFAIASVVTAIVAIISDMFLPGWVTCVLCLVIFVATGILSNRKVYGEIDLLNCPFCGQLSGKKFVRYDEEIKKREDLMETETEKLYADQTLYVDAADPYTGEKRVIEYTGSKTRPAAEVRRKVLYKNIAYGNCDSVYVCKCCQQIFRYHGENIRLDKLEEVEKEVIDSNIRPL